MKSLGDLFDRQREIVFARRDGFGPGRSGNHRKIGMAESREASGDQERGADDDVAAHEDDQGQNDKETDDTARRANRRTDARDPPHILLASHSSVSRPL